MRKIVYNAAKCGCCGDTIVSRHRHDYVSCTCGGVVVDGGLDYLRRGFSKDCEVVDLSVYLDEPFEKIRTVLARGGRGKDGQQPLTYVLLKDMSNSWLEAVIEYNEVHGIISDWYQKELDYRFLHGITIEDGL